VTIEDGDFKVVAPLEGKPGAKAVFNREILSPLLLSEDLYFSSFA